MASVAEAAAKANQAYLGELLQQSRIARLANDRLWHRLLHYRPRLTGGYLSEVDDPRFFLAATGKTNPQAELEATLRAFFSERSFGASQQPVQCAFIARYHWLRSVLAINTQQLPSPPCEDFERWWSALNPAAITLIFASAYMNNPASMFGHTLFRIDQHDQNPHTRLLAYTVSYAAHDTSSNPLNYAFAGLTGGFRGYLDIKPYYELVKEYGDIENRDLWEYRLALDARQIERMLRHVWELQEIYFDYFFFKENCSYRLLALLEVADPNLNLTGQFHGWAIPPDTVRLLTEQPGLVASVTPRPARSTVVRRQLSGLSETEKPILAELVRQENATLPASFSRLPVSRQALLLDTAIDFLQYREASDERSDDAEHAERRHLHHLLTTRSRLPAAPGSLTPLPYATQPEQGHGSARVGFGLGWRGNTKFFELSARAAFHDLLDPGSGYTPNAQIEAMDFAARYYPIRDTLRLQRLTVLDMISLVPLDGLLKAPSWRVRAGWERTKQQKCDDCLNFNVNGGIGSAWTWNESSNAVAFAFPEIDANYSRAFDDRYRIGLGITLGLSAQLTDDWQLLTNGSYWLYPWGDEGDAWHWFLGSNHALSKHWSLRFELDYRDQENIAVVGLHHYF